MNIKEVSESILQELEYGLEELQNLDNREMLERQGIDVNNDIERYTALISSFKVMVTQSQAFDFIRYVIEQHYALNTEHRDVVHDIDRLVDSAVNGGVGEASNLHLHVKTGGTYQVINESVINATNSANSEEMVLYKDTASGKLFVRNKEEFNDGRFIPIEGSNELETT